jgi:hypothetical protein
MSVVLWCRRATARIVRWGRPAVRAVAGRAVVGVDHGHLNHSRQDARNRMLRAALGRAFGEEGQAEAGRSATGGICGG